MRHVTLDRLDQVGNEIVSPLQLHLDLREGILVAVAVGDELVVDAHDHRADHNDDGEDDQERDETGHEEPPLKRATRNLHPATTVAFWSDLQLSAPRAESRKLIA